MSTETLTTPNTLVDALTRTSIRATREALSLVDDSILTLLADEVRREQDLRAKTHTLTVSTTQAAVQAVADAFTRKMKAATANVYNASHYQTESLGFRIALRELLGDAFDSGLEDAIGADLQDNWPDIDAATVVRVLGTETSYRPAIVLLRTGVAGSHAACPVHAGQWFNKSTGACSCGAQH